MIPKVSIIIPIYNVEKYISACLESVLNQSFKDIEIICVNDGTPDNSMQIVEEYAIKDERIRILQHTHNQGLGPARNSGMAEAQAPYLLFVDSDDFIENTMVEEMFNAIENSQSDMVWSFLASATERGEKCYNNDPKPSGVFTAVEILSNKLFYPSVLSSCGKLYRAEVIKDIKQPAIVSEDQPFMAECLLRCVKIQVIDKAYYYYRNREGTLSKPKLCTARNWDDFFEAHKRFFVILGTNYDKNALTMQSLKRLFSMLWRIKKFSLVTQTTWAEQYACIYKHLKTDSIPIPHNHPFYRYLLFVFGHHWSQRTLPHFINKGIGYASYWCENGTWIGTIGLFCREMLRYGKLWLVKVIDKVEIAFIRLCALLTSKGQWLIGERVDTAQENGYYFYQYLQKNEPQIKSYYIALQDVLTKYAICKPLIYNSFKHKVLFYTARVYANSNYNVAYPQTVFGKKYYPVPKHQLNVFLQHGITCADVSLFYGKQTSNINLFVCGAKPEYDAIVRDFGYNSDEVVLTGFARFDGLHTYQRKPQILFMPTWRRGYEYITEDDFLKSSYYLAIKDVLTDQELLFFLRQASLRLLFSPHYLMRKHLSSFMKLQNDVIEVVDSQVIPVQTLLKESLALISDVSSIQFDFVYMKKPILYYLWDYEEIIQTHLKKGYFDFDSMGFGPITHNVNELLENLKQLQCAHWQLNSHTIQRIENFFPYMDNHNCQRIYKMIQSKL